MDLAWPKIPMPPSPLLYLVEGRAVGELATSYAVNPWLRKTMPRGDGHPVLVMPGFVASDISTQPLRRFLKQQGWSAHRWRQGRNLGFTEELEERLANRLNELYQAYQKPVSLVGWSLGGVYAREMARNNPEAVRCVISLGSPFAGSPKSTNVWRIYELVVGMKIEDIDQARLKLMRQPPPVPSTAIYSKTDGVAAWESCTEVSTERTENVEVRGSHCGLGFNPLVYTVIADRLAQKPDRWQPFRRSGLRRHFYRRPSYPRQVEA